MTACTALTAAGTPCRMTPRRDSGLCLNHDPAYVRQQRRNQAAAGRASGQARRAVEPVDLEYFHLSSRASIQALLDGVLRLELLGRLERGRARLIVRILALAVRNFDHPGAASAFRSDPVQHDRDVYLWVRSHFDELAPAILESAHAADLARRQQSADAAPGTSE